jgi:hypothetical protein
MDAPTFSVARHFSRREYEKMIDAGILGEEERVELVAGRVVQMSPEGPAGYRNVGLFGRDAEISLIAAPGAVAAADLLT